MVSSWLSLCWRPWAPFLGPRTFPGPTPHLAWKVRGTPSSHLVEGPGSPYRWYQFLGTHSPFLCPVNVFTLQPPLCRPSENGDPYSPLMRGVN